MKKFLVTVCFIILFSVNSHCESEKYIALTFDDGPHTKYTLEILDILKEYNVRATFFIIGENAEKHPDILDKIINSGCEVGNHTWSHAYLDKCTEEEIRLELEKTDKLIKKHTGSSPLCFRPPGGRGNEKVLKIADEMGYATILWSKDTRDWSCPPVDDVISSVLSQTENGDIVLFHDYNAKNSPTPEALRQILPDLLSEGYIPITVSEMINLFKQNNK